jgi:zinc metalloprotease ZmpB
LGGIDHCCYGLGDSTNIVNPVGRACDPWVHYHELGGHGILYEHVDSPNFGFSHSAGDSLSSVANDPDSIAPDRFLYTPWRPIRRFDRRVADGWAWGGQNDNLGYGSEQILSTTLFRIYRSIGGDSTDIHRKRFSSRMMLYLILRAVSTLTPATNPDNALGLQMHLWR